METKTPPLTELGTARAFRFALLFTLGMTEIMPVALISSAMPVLLRKAGASFEELGVLSLVMFPWALKALWAPLVDKIGARSRFGRYRAWLFITHPLLLLTLLLGAWVDIPALMLHERAVGIPALIWLSIISATADTASHGLAVNLLAPEERGVGNGVQTAGMMLGKLIGGGLMIMLVDQMGFRLPMLIMAASLLLPLIGVALYREPPVESTRSITFRDALTFFRRRRIGRWLGVLGVLSLLPDLPTSPFQAMFVDHGMGLSEIGLVLGVLSSTAGGIGGAVGGLVVRELGRQRAFFSLNLVCVLCLSLASVIITRSAPGRPLLYLSVGFVVFGLSMVGTILRVMIMDRSRSHLASSDYTLQVSVMSFFGFVGNGAGAFVAGRYGASSVFIFVPVAILAALGGCLLLLNPSDFSVRPDGMNDV